MLDHVYSGQKILHFRAYFTRLISGAVGLVLSILTNLTLMRTQECGYIILSYTALGSRTPLAPILSSVFLPWGMKGL